MSSSVGREDHPSGPERPTTATSRISPRVTRTSFACAPGTVRDLSWARTARKAQLRAWLAAHAA